MRLFPNCIMYYFLLFTLHSSTICMSQDVRSDKSNAIHELISLYAEYGDFNGAILVAEEGQVIYKNGFGLANMEWETLNQPDTKFRLASITKQFTAMLIMQLVAEGQLNLDQTISTYLPDYPKETGEKITIHHLLTHTSGIASYTSFPNYRDIMRTPTKPSELLEMFADSSLRFTPGQRFDYSNSGYAVLGYIIEKITGKSFGDVLDEKIATPLKMTNTGYINNQDILKNSAAGYFNNLGNFTNASYIDMSVGYSAGGIYSTVEDLYIWDQALYTEELLPKEYMGLIYEKHIPSWGGHYGYGWHMAELKLGTSNRFLPTVEHDGTINGFNTMILRVPSNRTTIILLNNTGHAPLYNLRQGIAGILYNEPYNMPKQSIAKSLLKVIQEKGLTKGFSFYEEVKDNSNYVLDEREMNLAGYHLLQSDYKEEAVRIFKLNIEAHPNSFNAYDSYAESLNAIGQKEQAINNYKKSISLNPKNENGILMLEKLGVTIDRAKLYLLDVDPNWSKEIFTFPLNFAKDLRYEGKEEAYFPKGWRNQDSDEFWSYSFVWKINQKQQPSKSKLEKDLQVYFDGLLNVVNKNKETVLPKTVASLHHKEDLNTSTYIGSIDIFDTFITNKNMTLQVNVQTHYCKAEEKSVILFRFSPQDFGMKIWNTLKELKLRANYCEE